MTKNRDLYPEPTPRPDVEEVQELEEGDSVTLTGKITSIRSNDWELECYVEFPDYRGRGQWILQRTLLREKKKGETA